MKKLKVSDHYKSLNEEEIKNIQKSIDNGKAVVVYNKLDNFDGKFSYIAGHNPGIMSSFAKFVKKDREICVYDNNGEKRYYKLQFLAEQDYNDTEVCDKVNEVIEQSDSLEAIVFQFCVSNNKIHFWIATPAELS